MSDNESKAVIDHLLNLASLHDDRIIEMRATEKRSGFTNPNLDRAIRFQKELLVSIQEMAFNVGLDEYKRGTPWQYIAANEAQKQEVQRQCYEAYRAAEEVFKDLESATIRIEKVPTRNPE